MIVKNAKDYYDQYMSDYSISDPRSVGYANNEAYQKRIDCLAKYLGDEHYNKSTLDFGCGVHLGYYKNFQPERYLGVDCNEEALSTASKYYDIPIVSTYTMGRALLMTARNYYLSSNLASSFDQAILMGVLHDQDTLKSAYSLMNNVFHKVKPGGVMVVMTSGNRVNRNKSSELFMSAHDLLGFASFTGSGVVLSIGELGEHIIAKYIKSNE